MDRFQLAKFKERARKATPGPWRVARRNNVSASRSEDESFIVESETTFVDKNGTHHQKPPQGANGQWASGKEVNSHDSWLADVLRLDDAEFIADSREDVPRLVSEVGRLYAELDRREGLFVEESKSLRVQIEQLQREAEAGRERIERLKASEERLAILFEHAPDGYYLSDLKGTFVDGNRAAEEMCGYGRDELVGKNFLMSNLLTPREIAKAAKLLAQNALGMGTGPNEFTLKRKDGRRVLVEIRTYPVKINGRTLVLGIARDITARKRAEDALRQSEERYERAANAGRVGVWKWDLSTGEMHIDPNLKSLLGFENAEIGNHVDDWASHVYPADIERVRDATEACTGGEPLRYELEHRMVHKDGSVRWFQARGTVLQDHEGKPRRMVGTDLDVTSLKRAEEEKALLEAKLRHSRVQKHSCLQLFATAIVDSLGGCVPRFVEKERRPPLRHQGIRSGGNLRVFENLAQTLVAVDAP